MPPARQPYKPDRTYRVDGKAMNSLLAIANMLVHSGKPEYRRNGNWMLERLDPSRCVEAPDQESK